jgi:hypothetical protein
VEDFFYIFDGFVDDTGAAPVAAAADATYYAHFAEIAHDEGYGVSIALEDSIAIKWRITRIPEQADWDKYSATYEFHGETKTIDSDLNVKTEVARCAAKEMTDVVNIKVTYDGVEIADLHYSVRDYCKAALEMPEMERYEKLMEATLLYGGEAQTYKTYRVDDLASEGINVPADYRDEIQVADLTRIIGADGNTGISFKLITEAETIMIVSFAHENGKTVSDYTFAVNGKDVTSDVADVDGKFEVVITGIAAKALSDDFTVTMTAQDGSRSTFVGSPVNYMKLAHDQIPALADMMLAMYNYNQYALDIFAN